MIGKKGPPSWVSSCPQKDTGSSLGGSLGGSISATGFVGGAADEFIDILLLQTESSTVASTFPKDQMP